MKFFAQLNNIICLVDYRKYQNIRFQYQFEKWSLLRPQSLKKWSCFVRKQLLVCVDPDSKSYLLSTRYSLQYEPQTIHSILRIVNNLFTKTELSWRANDYFCSGRAS